ncbi:MAG: phosphatase PAP2 family protein [Pseudomonadota bacterium]
MRAYQIPVTPQGLLIAFIVLHLPFAIWPALDLVVSGLFYHPVSGFWLGQSWLGSNLRHIIHQLMLATGFFGLLGLVMSLVYKRPMLVPQRDWAFVTFLYILGPGLLVNSLFKEFWGRARPRDVFEFGGDLSFTPVFQISDQCDFNCSFTSGEGAGATAMALSVWVLTHGLQDERLRHRLRSIALILALTGIVLRIVFGAHFTSDTLFSIFFVLTIAFVLARFLKPSALISK